MFHCTSYIVNRIPKEQGKGIIKKMTECKDKAKSRKRQKGGVQTKKNRTEGKQIYINETTQKLKHLQIFHAREVLYVVN